MGKYEVMCIRDKNVIFIGLVFMDGSKQEIGRFLLPNDRQWRLDVAFIDEIVSAYKKRINKIK